MVSLSGSNRSSSSLETELLLLSGSDRLELLANIAELLRSLQNAPTILLKDLAFTLNTQESHQAVRLAVVASSIEDFGEKLDRAADRLKDPNCRQIRDVQGIFFVEQPLGVTGKLAMLFPGEGAPYLGMIAGLASQFPEVADVISQCDAMSREQGSAPLSRFLSVPEDLAERDALERELHGLGNTMFSVLMVDWALWGLFQALEIRPQAMAGHSAGNSRPLGHREA